MNNKVLILLSTYNGEKYLSEQLDSLMAQSDVDIKVLVRDDGSTDITPHILSEYQKKFPDKFILNLSDNIGCIGSFFALMKLAAEEYRDFDYYAFSDQDDVWRADKLKVAVRALSLQENPIKLYYCDPQLVDSTLVPIESTPIRAKGTLKEAIILQPCIGCSMVVSKELLEKASIIDAKNADVHDTWTYRVCLSLGGVIVHDPSPYILYRQHASNVIGRRQGFMRKWERRLSKFFSTYRFRSRQARLLLNSYGSEIPDREKSILLDISTYHDSLKKKMAIIFDKNFSSYYRIHNLMFKIAVLFGKI